MKIIQVTPGIIPIPPNGWGAVEKIIWEFHNNLLSLGHDSQITYLDDVPSDADIVHIHVANLALLAHERGIPYYFTLHDHHAYLNGKDSWTYKENLEAMKHAIKSFVPAKYLVEYFENIPEYFSHGVNTNYFTPASRTEHRLLCVANNGYAHDQTIDRKGFGMAIEVARKLNLPITIAGPSNNKNYFTKHPPSYDKLTILYDLSEEELLTVYKQHSIFLHPSELEAGHPNLTLLEALSCGLPVVGTLESGVTLSGMVVTSRDVSDLMTGVTEVLRHHNEYKILARTQAEQLSWKRRTKELLSIYTSQHSTMKQKLIQHYNSTQKLNKKKHVTVNYHNVDGAFVELLGGDNSSYDVSFINKRTNQTAYSVELTKNHWARPSIQYYVDWKIVVANKSTKESTEHHLDLRGKRVFICFESKSLGDTLAWIPYVEEFRKTHGCTVICSTFWNHLFAEKYTDIEFVTPTTTVHDLSALYRLGLFYTESGEVDMNRHPKNPITIPLQQVATDILGLPYKEIRPTLKSSGRNNTDSKQVCVAIHSTAQAKYWNNPFGWQEVVNWLNNRGYIVKLLSEEGDGYMGNRLPSGLVTHPRGPIESVIDELNNSKAFIGIGSGLSWLSWGLNVPTVLISGFSYNWTEMQDCIRIGAPKGKCSGCFNRHRLNAGDWNWCPDHKGTARQFECSREITSDTVIKELEKIL
jgi:autotransporter strand-loop-strand O-heptosyltransferase